MSKTSTVKMCGLWFVLLLRAADDYSTIRMTLKERSRGVAIVDRMYISMEAFAHFDREEKLLGAQA